jgi:fructosamine-3-kinase
MMTELTDTVRTLIRETLGAEPTRIKSVGGGMINQAACVEVNGVRYFVKWKSNAPPLFFEVEARGLALLRSAHILRVPEVIAYGEATEHASAYLIVEWIASVSNPDPKVFSENLGHGLAALHRVTALAFGLDHDNYIGELPQRNTLTASWPAFYRAQRIGVQMEIARKSGYLPPYREAMLHKLLDKIENILGGSNNPPSLLHGDLWAGNFMATSDNQPAVFDPAVHYGDREVEIAYTELFGGLPRRFHAAYREAYPLALDYEYRRPLLQLSPMLVHLNHFGEGYGSGVDEICQRYVTD